MKRHFRQFFHRPGGTNRFCSENEHDLHNLFKTTKANGPQDDDTSDEQFERDDYLQGHATAEDIEKVRKEQGISKIFSQSKLLRLMDDDPMFIDLNKKYLQEQLHDLIPANHREKEKSQWLFQRAFDEENPVHLLRLYTLETPFYREMGSSNDSFLEPLQFFLSKAKSRYFKGTSYRGLTMSTNDLRPYQWSLKNKAAIETKTFCSTSIDLKVAQGFAETAKAGNDRRKVLMVFNFPKKTEQAINLGKISDKELCISDYEHEAEVLVLPETLFLVKGIETNSKYTTISLEHIFVKRRSLLGGLQDVLKEQYNERHKEE